MGLTIVPYYAAALAFLFAISEGLESWSMARTRYGLRALLSLVPERATVLRDGAPVEVEPAQLQRRLPLRLSRQYRLFVAMLPPLGWAWAP